MIFICPLCGNTKTTDDEHPIENEVVSKSRPIRILCNKPDSIGLPCKGWMPPKIGVLDGV